MVAAKPKPKPKVTPRDVETPASLEKEMRTPAKKKAMAGIAARGKKKTGRAPSKATVAATYAKWHAPKVAKAKAAADEKRKHVDMPMRNDLPIRKTIVPPPNPERDAAVGNIRTTPSPLPQPGSSAPPSSSSSSGAVSRDIGWRDPTPSIVPIGRRDRPIDRLTPPSSSSYARGLPKPPKSLKRAPGQTNTRSHI